MPKEEALIIGEIIIQKTRRRRKSGRKRRHLCAAPALLPVLLLQLCVLHSQLEAGQLGHERLVTHMERVRDGELERERTEDRKWVMMGGVGREEAEDKVKRARLGEELIKRRGWRERVKEGEGDDCKQCGLQMNPY